LNCPYIIAEIASAHEGKLELLKILYEEAILTGTDAVKVQIFCRDELLSKMHHKYEAFGEIELTEREWKEFFNFTKKYQTDLLVEVFDNSSLNLVLENCNPQGFKIPTSDISNREFLEKIAKTKKDIYLGIGGATKNEIYNAIEILQQNDASKLILMHGFQSFPTRLEDTNLNQIYKIKELFDLEVGFADHVDAEDKYWRMALPDMAITAGATVIEKHITLDRALKGRDYYSSLNPHEFKSFVKNIKAIENIFGESQIGQLNEAEIEYRSLMKKQAVVNRDLKEDEIITETKLSFRRTGEEGISEYEAENVYGKKVKKIIKAGHHLKYEDLKN